MMNSVQVIGYVGRDPEARAFPSGGRVANFSVAATEKWKGRDGSPNEHTEWFRCVARDKLVDVVEQYVRKGTLLFVQGSLRTRQYEQGGETKYSTELQVHTLKLLPSGNRDGGGDSGGYSRSPAPAPRAPAPAPSKPSSGFDDMDDDIPF